MEEKDIKSSLKRKITRMVLELVIVSIGTVGLITVFMMFRTKNIVRESGNKLEETVSAHAETFMKEQSDYTMSQIVDGNARYMNTLFEKLRTYVQMEADFASNLYANAAAYQPFPVSEPVREQHGELAVQLLYSKGIKVKLTDAQKEEIGLLGNASDFLYQLNNGWESLASNYITSESGFSIVCDAEAGGNFKTGSNEPVPFEAEKRPWYQGAVQTGKPFFTDVTQDANGGGAAIMCGIPIYHDNKIKGVAGGGIYLNDIEQIVDKTKVGETGFSVIINQNGEIIFSSREEGEFKQDEINQTDLRKSGNKQLASLITEMMKKKSGVFQAVIDSKSCCLAYSRMDVVNWYFLTVIEEDEVLADAWIMKNNIIEQTENMVKGIVNNIFFVIVLILIVTVLLAFVVLKVSVKNSVKITEPMERLTDAVKKFGGGSMQFNCTIDTGDEIEVLAGAFGKMSQDLKEYMENLMRVTAEKEQIGAELNIATQIQMDMLPRIFPYMPNRKEFNLYAMMEPAKEVGGDFYDYFMTDEDHLVIVAADVSGKGVPAALFMVIAKTLIKNHMQSKDTPAAAFYNTNNELCEGNDAMMFATAFLGVLTVSTGELVYVNAGHVSPMLLHGDGSVSWLRCKAGLVLGALQNIGYEQESIFLKKGERIFLYTDGIPEAINQREEEYGETRMEKFMQLHGTEPMEEVLRKFREDIREFAEGAEQFDDITMLLVEYHFPFEPGKEEKNPQQ